MEERRDLISRQAAIDAVKKNTFRLTFAEEQNCEGHVAWSANAVYSDVIEGKLLELPSAETDHIGDVTEMVGNTISRQDVIDSIVAWTVEDRPDIEMPTDLIGRIKALPSAHPDLDSAYTEGYTQAEAKYRKMWDEMPKIIRKPVIGYEGYYEVDNCGRVYALDRVIHVEDHRRSYDKHLVGEIIKQHMHSNGYKIVSLTKDGKTKTVFVHRIVAMAFLANPDKLPCANHKDEDKTNNFAENLEWCTYQYNNAYGSKPKKHSKWMSGRKLSDEHKQHISDGHKRHWDKIRAERRTDATTI